MAVNKRWLFVLAGLMWSGVGGYLIYLAYGWLRPLPSGRAILLASAGVLLALVIYRFGFSRLAEKNIKRISQFKDRASIFAFQSWKSYIIIPVMIGLGIFLRKSPLPKQYLAIMYIGIGGGLFLSSLHYYVWLVRPSQLERGDER
ncbi:MAG: hypothetical protein KOO61_05180 [Spirochaetales bacterium]|nr:hypothetical protein [Spirochaetales bacterium]